MTSVFSATASLTSALLRSAVSVRDSLEAMKLYLAIALSAVLAAVSVASSVTYKDVVQTEWEEFKSQHNKVYPSEAEEKFRMKIYLENRHKISKHNLRAANGVKSYTLGMNEYGDLLHHEFVRIMNGWKNSTRRADSRTAPTFMIPLNFQLPKSVDWRDHGYVTPVKNQGHCGSCWSFSTTGALEGQNFRKTGQLVSLSEQNLVDCSGKFDNQGCNGGLMDNAFSYIEENGGIDTEETYPYEGKQGTCRFQRRNVGAKDTGFIDIPASSETHLTHALATVGPVSVAIDAGHETFQFYRSGVYYEPECSSQDLDHGVLAVGYATDAHGKDYYIVKNSWGTSWGNKGYVYMARNKNNHCGIATAASYPLV